MFTLLGAILGFSSSMFPMILDFFKDKSDKKQEIATMQMQLELQKNQSVNNINEQQSRAESAHDLAELDALTETVIQAHKTQPSTGIKFIDGLRGSVRPMITYLMVSLYIASKIFTLIYAFKGDSSLLEFAKIAFTQDDLAILATILSFWFGERIQNARR